MAEEYEPSKALSKATQAVAQEFKETFSSSSVDPEREFEAVYFGLSSAAKRYLALSLASGGVASESLLQGLDEQAREALTRTLSLARRYRSLIVQDARERLGFDKRLGNRLVRSSYNPATKQLDLILRVRDYFDTTNLISVEEESSELLGDLAAILALIASCFRDAQSSEIDLSRSSDSVAEAVRKAGQALREICEASGIDPMNVSGPAARASENKEDP